MAIFGRKKKEAEEKGKLLSLEDMKQDLQDKRGTLMKEKEEVLELLTQAEEDVKAWRKRIKKVKNLIAITKQEDALEALVVLEHQAIRFHQRETQAVKRHRNRIAVLEASAEKLDKALARIDLSEKRELLNRHLQLVESTPEDSDDDVFGGADEKDDSVKEIQKLVHTTNAYLEIRESKAVAVESSQLRITSGK